MRRRLTVVALVTEENSFFDHDCVYERDHANDNQTTNRPMPTINIKICGLTNLADAVKATELGADFLGFIQVPDTPRYIQPETLRMIVSGLPREIPKVGVFMNETAERLADIMAYCGLDVAQLHGDESEQFSRGLAGRRIWKTVFLADETDVACALPYPAEALLVDFASGAQRGGTGQLANWDLAARLARQRQTLLAGGLNPGNVREAIRQVRPWGVDVSSGVEASKGKKDHGKLRDFIAAAREM